MIAAVSARILLAGLCLLALATSASAECAWVLWVMQGTTVDRVSVPPRHRGPAWVEGEVRRQ